MTNTFYFPYVNTCCCIHPARFRVPGCNFWARCHVGQRIPLQTIPHPPPPGRTPHPQPARTQEKEKKTNLKPKQTNILLHQCNDIREVLWMPLLTKDMHHLMLEKFRE